MNYLEIRLETTNPIDITTKAIQLAKTLGINPLDITYAFSGLAKNRQNDTVFLTSRQYKIKIFRTYFKATFRGDTGMVTEKVKAVQDSYDPPTFHAYLPLSPTLPINVTHEIKAW